MANEQKTGNCPKCGRRYPLNENGLLPLHKVLKGNGSRSILSCKGKGAKPVS